MSQFTKKAIIDAFVELISERPLSKITVKDIVTRCGVNRNTFYYYFEDIYALIDELFQLETEKAQAVDKALTHISASPKTRKQIKDFLVKKGYVEAVIVGTHGVVSEPCVFMHEGVDV